MSDSSFLKASVQYIKGVGPKRARLLSKLGINTVGELLEYYPRDYYDTSRIKPIREAVSNQKEIIFARILHKSIIKPARAPQDEIYKLQVGDSTGVASLLFFGQQKFFKFYDELFKIGKQILVRGKFKYRWGEIQSSDFEYELEENKTFLSHGRIVPIYRLGGGLKSSRFLRQIIRTALALYWDKLPEPLPEIIRRRYSLISLPEAIFNIHFPRDYPLLLKARIRLVFDEFFYLQLVLALKRYRYSQEKKGISFSPPGELVRRFYWGLDFELTSAQKRVIREITRDMLSSKPMSRLLQGDVGSGKTLVAIFAMLVAVESGYQTALMAPTEVLAEQHYFTFQNFLNKLNIPVSLLTASLKGQARVRALSQIKQGKTKIIIGTHALIQAEVKFHNLGLVIVDEQHKFGVTQRYQLRKKGLLPDMLVMTATPIPRTLTLTVYGDLELSLLDELPRGRAGIITRWVKEEDREQVYQFIKTRLLRGEQAYIVYPLIEESEKLLLKAACEMKEKLAKEVFPEFNVGLIHGRMTPQERVEIMEKFKAGEITLLVATTVIEVGLDIPNATIMVIEHAERFGLAQLHQLRGRIGRGRHQGYCFLLTSSKLSPEARERIKTIVSSTDGFEIAERDLKIRGPGELTGTRQHGLPSFKLANLGSDLRILKGARKAALELVKQEPSLKAYPLLRQKIIEEYKSGLKLVSIG